MRYSNSRFLRDFFLFYANLLKQSIIFIHFSAFSNEYAKAPAAITSDDRNNPIIASKFVHLVATSPFRLV